MSRAAEQVGPASGSRPRFTGRAAVLAVVFCAIALSLAYPVREYISQRRQIDELQLRHDQIVAQLQQLERLRARLHDPAYIRQQARDRLHMCMPDQMCYVVAAPAVSGARSTASRAAATPWYERLWSSVQQANQQQGSGPQGSGQQGSGPQGSGQQGGRNRGRTAHG